MSALICIGAGESQYPVILKAKELGHTVIAIDQNPNSLGFTIADEKLILSTFDANSLIEPIMKLSEKYNIYGILNRSSGPPVVTTAVLAQTLNIPSYSQEMANKIIQKHELMRKCTRYGIPAPKSTSFSKLGELHKIDFKYPCVLRPSLSLIGKSGVSLIRKKSELINAANHALNASINNIAILDEYIEGFDLSFISFVDNGELIPICIMDEINKQNNNGNVSGRGFAIPSIHADLNIKNKIYNIANVIIRKFEIIRSPFMISFRVGEDNNPKLIEIHLDLGGDLLIEKLFPEALNFDFLSFSISLLSGKKPELPDIHIKPCAIIYEVGTGLITERDSTILNANTIEELSILID